MADCLLKQAVAIRKDSNVNRVVIGGGVFQNRVLTEQVARLLHDNGFELATPGLTPVNDASISFGQIVEFAYRTK
jgi:hydrogenase maturation protein HypF